MRHKPGQADVHTAEIEITPEMIAVGAAMLEAEFGPYGLLPGAGERVARDVYHRMRIAGPEANEGENRHRLSDQESPSGQIL